MGTIDAAPNLSVPWEKFEEMLRLDLTEHIEKVQGYSYLKVHAARLFLKQYFPTFQICVVRSSDGLPFIETPENSAFEGIFFGVYLYDTATGTRSEIEWHPAMRRPTKGEKVVGPGLTSGNCRQIHDTLSRGIAKTIAYVTGLGYNLWLQMDEFDEPAVAPTKGKLFDMKRRAVDQYGDDPDDDGYDDDEDADYDDYDDDTVEEVVAAPPARATRARTSTTRKPAGNGGSLPSRRRTR